ncbi:MAG: GLPGLI family protein [Bacteroidetes bacterium]|nr:MAG: GLPGLI family protein [Bacteroidota bacterium]
MKAGIKLVMVMLFLSGTLTSLAQITSGRIVYERRTNLKKLYGNVPQMKRFINEENKIKKEQFELLFNDTCSAFLPIEDPNMERGMMSWMTQKNKTYQNRSQQTQMMIMDMFGQQIFVGDSIDPKKWKVTESKRYISNYHCRKALYEKNDTTRIYAWFAIDIEPSVGPEGITGLPGAILGLATEDGGIVYFAQEIQVLEPKKEQLSYTTGKNEVFTKESLVKSIEERMGGNKWGGNMMDNIFRW